MASSAVLLLPRLGYHFLSGLLVSGSQTALNFLFFDEGLVRNLVSIPTFRHSQPLHRSVSVNLTIVLTSRILLVSVTSFVSALQTAVFLDARTLPVSSPLEDFPL